MIYTTKSCPYCGHSYTTTSSASRRMKWGSPVKHCSICRNMYIDQLCVEPIIYSSTPIFKRNLTLVVSGCALFLFVILIPLSTFWVAASALCSFIFIPSLYEEVMLFTTLNDGEMLNSQKRCFNDEYILLLKNSGINISQEALEEIQKYKEDVYSKQLEREQKKKILDEERNELERGNYNNNTEVKKVLCANCGKMYPANSFGCIYCHQK